MELAQNFELVASRAFRVKKIVLVLMAKTSVYVSECKGGSMASDPVLLSETPAT